MTRFVLASIFLALACDGAARLHSQIEIAACLDRGWSPDDCTEAKLNGYRLPTRTSPKVEL